MFYSDLDGRKKLIKLYLILAWYIYFVTTVDYRNMQ